jgi:hypothetical protein
VVSSITAFPDGSIPIATWTASTATWNTSGGTNLLSVASNTRVVAGTNCTVTPTGTAYSVSCSGGGGGPTCTSGTVPYTSLTANATTQEITIISSQPALTGYVTSYINQDTNFTSGSITALYVSMGRSGPPQNIEMTGVPILLMSGGISTPFSFTPPSPLQTSSTYNVVLLFTSGGANLGNGSATNLTAGQISYSVCQYAY